MFFCCFGGRGHKALRSGNDEPVSAEAIPRDVIKRPPSTKSISLTSQGTRDSESRVSWDRNRCSGEPNSTATSTTRTTAATTTAAATTITTKAGRTKAAISGRPSAGVSTTTSTIKTSASVTASTSQTTNPTTNTKVTSSSTGSVSKTNTVGVATKSSPSFAAVLQQENNTVECLLPESYDGEYYEEEVIDEETYQAYLKASQQEYSLEQYIQGEEDEDASYDEITIGSEEFEEFIALKGEESLTLFSNFSSLPSQQPGLITAEGGIPVATPPVTQQPAAMAPFPDDRTQPVIGKNSFIPSVETSTAAGKPQAPLMLPENARQPKTESITDTHSIHTQTNENLPTSPIQQESVHPTMTPTRVSQAQSATQLVSFLQPVEKQETQRPESSKKSKKSHKHKGNSRGRMDGGTKEEKKPNKAGFDSPSKKRSNTRKMSRKTRSHSEKPDGSRRRRRSNSSRATRSSSVLPSSTSHESTTSKHAESSSTSTRPRRISDSSRSKTSNPVLMSPSGNEAHGGASSSKKRPSTTNKKRSHSQKPDGSRGRRSNSTRSERSSSVFFSSRIQESTVSTHIEASGEEKSKSPRPRRRSNSSRSKASNLTLPSSTGHTSLSRKSSERSSGKESKAERSHSSRPKSSALVLLSSLSHDSTVSKVKPKRLKPRRNPSRSMSPSPMLRLPTDNDTTEGKSNKIVSENKTKPSTHRRRSHSSSAKSHSRTLPSPTYQSLQLRHLKGLETTSQNENKAPEPSSTRLRSSDSHPPIVRTDSLTVLSVESTEGMSGKGRRLKKNSKSALEHKGLQQNELLRSFSATHLVNSRNSKTTMLKPEVDCDGFPFALTRNPSVEKSPEDSKEKQKGQAIVFDDSMQSFLSTALSPLTEKTKKSRDRGRSTRRTTSSKVMVPKTSLNKTASLTTSTDVNGSSPYHEPSSCSLQPFESPKKPKSRKIKYVRSLSPSPSLS